MGCTLWLIALIVPSIADRGAPESSLDSAAAQLHNQILEYERSVGAMDNGMPRLSANLAPSFAQTTYDTSLALSDSDAQLARATQALQVALAQQQPQQPQQQRQQQQQQQVPPPPSHIIDQRLQQVERQPMPSILSNNLDLAAERLVLQQRLASAQLENTGAMAQNVLARLRQPASSVPTHRTSSLLSLRQQAVNRPKDPLALPQTATTHKNPALFALLLEPLLYGYSAVLWAFFVLLTGASSAICFYAGKSLQFKFPGTQPLADNGEAGYGAAPVQKHETSRRDQFFQYPGSSNHRLAGRAATWDDEEDAEGAEIFIRVPAKPASHSLQQGCRDDELNSHFAAPSGRIQHCGYVDDY